jgi:probable rRNA maturation factor
MIDVEVLGSALAPDAPPLPEIERLCGAATARFEIDDAHVAIEFVDAARISELNASFRDKQGPTDVLSFPIDGAEPLAAVGAAPPPRELGDIVICPEHTHDLREAIVHGMLHLLGMDHEHDDGQMLVLQDELLSGAAR